MYTSKWTLIIATLLLNTAYADESCDEQTLDILAKHLKLKEYLPRSDGGIVIAETCKIWPYKPTLTLAAFAYDTQKANVTYEESPKQITIALINNKNQQLVSDFQKIIEEDATTEIDGSSFLFDTARYQLSKSERAFGVRFNSAAIGASCGEARWNNQLTLFVPTFKKLSPILSIYMTQQRSIKGCLSVFSPDAIWENADLSLSMKKSKTHGYADILVTAKITSDANNENIESPADRIETYTLYYDGQRYLRGKDFPWWLMDGDVFY